MRGWDSAMQVAVEYEAFLLKDGLTLAGLKQTYDDGIGSVDIDFETLGLDLVRQACKTVRYSLQIIECPHYYPCVVLF
jgi:hypothetical protein